MALLKVEGMVAGYDTSQVLFDVGLSVERGEAITLMGRNGMGKTTTVKAIMGMIKATAGTVYFNGSNMTGCPPHLVAQAGIGLVPEGRQVFPTLTVEENLISIARAKGSWDLNSIYDFFPVLGERRHNMGTQLSGGEQQMLAIGRALMTNPDLLLLDEATEGLAPLIRAEIWSKLALLKRQGIAVLVIDKNIVELSKIADRHYILEKGVVVWQGSNSELMENSDISDKYLHL